MSALGSLVLLQCNPPKSGMPNFGQFWNYKWEIFSLGLCGAMNIVMNNASLIMIGLFVNQVLKALSPIFTMLSSYYLLNRTYSCKIIWCVLFVTFSAVAAIPLEDFTASPLGIVLVLISTVVASIKPVIAELVMVATSKPKLEPATIVFYESCFAFFLMFTYWVVQPLELRGSLQYMQTNQQKGWIIIALGSFSAFGYNLSIYYFTRLCSALGVMIATKLLKVVLITASGVIEGDLKLEEPSDWIGWIGLIVFFIAVFVYAYYSWEEKQQKMMEKKAREQQAKDEQQSEGALPDTEKSKV
jgi:drug/metabolite transporter (DMT)-like permease